MSVITIRGEKGKAFGPAEVPFSEVGTSGSLTFQSTSPDRLTFIVEPKLITASGAKIPEVGQTMELLIDGRREFVGVVTRAPASWKDDLLSVSIEVSGPWWRLEETPLTDLITVNESDVERPQFRCPKGNVRDHLIRLLVRAKSLGMPIEIGEIAACYDSPTTTFRDVSFGHAIAELMAQVPDSVAWWDYSGPGDPRFNLTRRNIKDPLTLTIGADGIIAVEVEPEIDLKVDQVAVESATRAKDGSIEYRSMKAGSGNQARQIVTVSGPELAEILPPDPLDSVTVTSTAAFIGAGGTISDASFRGFWKFWREAVAEHSPVALPTLKRYGEFPADDDRYPDGVTPKYYREDGSVLLHTHPRRRIAETSDFESLPEWFGEQVKTDSAKMKGTWYVFLNFIAGTPISSQATPFQKALIQRADASQQITGGGVLDLYLWFNVDEPCSLIEPDLAGVTYHQQPAYTFESPPDDYARNLLAAQSFLPYSGGVDLQLQPGGFKRQSGATLNIVGGLPQWESMGAIIQGESLDLENGIHTLEVGVPNRRSGASSLTMIKRDPADNVVLL